MAIRTIRTDDDPILKKISKPVKNFTAPLKILLDDMAETMHAANGVGLAAPQVGTLKRIFIIDVGEGLVEFINPEILETSGEQCGDEGCLSVPKRYGKVTRPFKVKVRAQNRTGEFFEMEVEELFARAVCHENDHLDGKLFVELVEGSLYEDTEDEENEE